MAPVSRLVSPAVTLLLGVLVTSALAQTQPQGPKPLPAPPAGALEVATIGLVQGGVEVFRAGGTWTSVAEGQTLVIGDRLRTLRAATARLELPWTAVAVGDSTELSIEKNRVLTLKLIAGRIDVDPEQDLVRVVTAEAAISGSGRTLIRREGATTFVGSYNGGADVEAADKVVRLGVNRSTVVNANSGPGDAAVMPAPPRLVSPSSDPRYVRPGQNTVLTWTGNQSSYHLEILPIDSDVPVISLDVDAMEFNLRLDWLGTFRWRVSGRTGPVETQPSGEGLICVVEK